MTHNPQQFDEEAINAVARSVVSAYLLSNPPAGSSATCSSSSGSSTHVVHSSMTGAASATRLPINSARGPACSSMARVL